MESLYENGTFDTARFLEHYNKVSELIFDDLCSTVLCLRFNPPEWVHTQKAFVELVANSQEIKRNQSSLIRLLRPQSTAYLWRLTVAITTNFYKVPIL